jgi:hypothetical protein
MSSVGGVWPTAVVHPDDLDTNGTVLRDAAEFISGLVKPRNNWAKLKSIMRIYFDEAGGFVAPAARQTLFSLVLAVVVPSSIEIKLFDEFSHLLASCPSRQKAEINYDTSAYYRCLWVAARFWRLDACVVRLSGFGIC